MSLLIENWFQYPGRGRVGQLTHDYHGNEGWSVVHRGKWLALAEDLMCVRASGEVSYTWKPDTYFDTREDAEDALMLSALKERL